MSHCENCYNTNTITPCATVGCLSTNYGKCVTYSGSPLYCATGGIGTVSFTGTAVPPLTDTSYTLSPTGGTGTGLSVKVTTTVGSTAYTVEILSVGSGYTVNDTITIVGASLGGATPTNNLVLTVTSLAALISSSSTMDDAITNLHQRLCTITSTGLNYSGFNYACLRQGGALTGLGSAITTAQQFTEATAAALCSLNTRVSAVETPTFTVPSCISGITSGSSTLGAVLTAYGSKICTLNTNLDMSGVNANPCSLYYSYTAKPTSNNVADYINWITTNLCGVIIDNNTTFGTITTRIDNITRYITGTTSGSIPTSIDTSCMSGGSSTSSLVNAVNLMISQICSLNTTVSGISGGSFSLPWATNFGSTAYYGYTFNYTNTADTLTNQLNKVVAVLGRLKLKLNASHFTATSDSDGLNVSLNSSVIFSCSSLNSCSIDNLGDVTISSPSTYHGLFWNGSAWVNKELIFTSSDSTATITRANNVSDITVDIKVPGITTGTGTTTGSPQVIPSTRYSIGGTLPTVHKNGTFVLIRGSFVYLASTGITLTNGTNMLGIPAGFSPSTNQTFNITMALYLAASPTTVNTTIQGVAEVTGGILKVYFLNSTGSVTLSTGDSLEIFVGGNTYVL